MANAKIYALRNMYLIKHNDVNYVVNIPRKVDLSLNIDWDNITKFEAGSLLGELLAEMAEDWCVLHNDELGMVMVKSDEVSKEFR